MMHCTLIGDHSVLLDFSKSAAPLESIHGISKLLFANKPWWAKEIVSGLDSLVIELSETDLDPKQTRKLALAELEKFLNQTQQQKKKGADKPVIHTIKVCYHPDLALDIQDIAKACKLSIDEVIRLHQEPLYTADILGFMPGFAYFSGLNPKLQLPRLPSPRPFVPKGSVAIAELQTAIYPRSTPGGWNLIGRSPNALFDIHKQPPGLFMAGDQMKIQEISLDAFHKLDRAAVSTEIIRLPNPNKNTAAIEVIHPGTFTSIQDDPRTGLSHWAVGPGGSTDLNALHFANALVGNPIDMAALEITSTGPSLKFNRDTCIAWVGADCEGVIDGILVPGNRPVWVAKGSILKMGALQNGYRIVLSIGGGLDLPEILGKKGSHLSADIGAKRVEKGSHLFLQNPIAPCSSLLLKALHEKSLPSFPKWKIKAPFTIGKSITPVFCLPGPHLDFLSTKEKDAFWSTIWTVSTQSNRMGARLTGEFKLKKGLPNIPSQAIHFGTIQFPPSQEPIVMLSEHQTTGGYPRLAEVIQSERSKLAQLKPGTQIRLMPITLEEADCLNAEALKLYQSTLYSIQTTISASTKDS